MISASQIKHQITTSLTSCGVFDTVLTPADDRMDNTIMSEPSAAVYYKGCNTNKDNGHLVTQHNFTIHMKFLKIGVNETIDDIEIAIDALKELEPSSLKQTKLSNTNGRSAAYSIEASFAGCRA